MKRGHTRAVDHFEELLDRDIESLLAGGHVANTDLVPLREFVEGLRSLADRPLPKEFVEFHAAEAAATAAEARAGNTPRHQPDRPGQARSLRFRLVTTAATLAMLLGATGMAWAADGAAPGDWNYGLDRALEAVGIGAGGAAERLDESRAISPESSSASDHPGQPPSTDVANAGAGLERAPAAVSDNRPAAGNAEEDRSRAVEVLRYLNETERVDGAIVSDLASEGRSRPEEPGKSSEARPPEEKDIPGQVGPEDQAGDSEQSGRPEMPGPPAKGSSGRPEPKGNAGTGRP